jgi:outer membrane protein OmpA-like peptidoglycan-associated protein
MTGKTLFKLTASALALFATGASAGEAAHKRIAFVSCPMVRNTEVPCWLSAYAGELYYIGPQGDLGAEFYPPQLGHKVLVEGELSNDERICGGVVLKEVTASVLPEQDVSCNTILPAQGYPAPPNERGTGPSGVRGGEPPAPPPPRPAPPPPQPPFKAQSFTAYFNADTSRMWRPAQAAVRAAATYANQSKAAAVEVTGYRAAIKLMDGKTFTEDQGLARERAQVIAEALNTLGLPKDTKVTLKWVERPEGNTGDERDAKARRAEIRVLPGAA